MSKYKSIKGTRDILPDEAVKWQYVEKKIRQIMTRYNFREIRTPMFEDTELFARSIGQHTDIVGKEMYTFLDRGRKSLTLKPEMTAPVIRAWIEHSLGEKYSLLKLYYLSPLFRQENPQAGRFRQFHQFGAEIIGSPYATADGESIVLALDIYEELGLQNLSLKLNSVGCPQCRNEYKAQLRAFLKDKLTLLCEDCQVRYDKNPLRILDCKKATCRQLTEDVPVMLDFLCSECHQHFEQVQEYLQELNIAYEIDPRLVRGLDYYTRTAYEIISGELGSQDALGGGGRYDLLCEELGGPPTPGVGFAAGLERLLMVMEKQNLFTGKNEPLEVFIAPLGADARKWATKTARQLRKAGFQCETDHLARSLKAQMREANRQQARWVIMVGENEFQRQVATVRDMEKAEQKEVPFADIVDYLKSKNDWTASAVNRT